MKPDLMDKSTATNLKLLARKNTNVLRLSLLLPIVVTLRCAPLMSKRLRLRIFVRGCLWIWTPHEHRKRANGSRHPTGRDIPA
jgi:hypothetical protein